MSNVAEYPISRYLDPSLIGSFIGPEGMNISKIEKDNKVLLDICKNIDETATIVRITGMYWNMKKALHDIRSLVTRIRNNNNRYTFDIPTPEIGYLIGKNGAKINEIKLISNVNVEIDKQEELDDTKVTVIGSYNQTLIAMRLISDRMTSKGEVNPHDNPKTRQFAETLEEEMW